MMVRRLLMTLPASLSTALPASLVLALFVSIGVQPAQAAVLNDSEQAVVDRANLALTEIEKQRKVLYQASSQQEQVCLKKFISAPCLEDLRQSHAAASRDLDLAAEGLKEQIREAQASARARARGVQRAP
ncbi:MAG: hypothetical protein RL043_1436 [Pseudomonadota bacterium]|jgi:hypothetical protein